MGSPLAAAATGMRESQKLLRQQNMALCVGMLARYWKKCPNQPSQVDEIRIKVIHTLNQTSMSPWTQEEQGIIALQASHRVFGDPVQLAKDPLELKQYVIPYYNSSLHTLNIAPLGLEVKQVLPGGLVSIPQPLAKGGEKSAVYGIAPQLKPCPQQEKDTLLDLTPSTFVEWWIYSAYQLSPCHNRQILWSETSQCLICDKCSNRIEL